MSRFMWWAAVCCTAAAIALVCGSPDVCAGTVNGVAVDLDGNRLANITVTVTGGGVAVSNAAGAFTIATPDVRPVTLTLSGEGSQTVTVTNLDGTVAHTLTVVVPAIDAAAPCPVLHQPCCEVKHRRRLFHRH